MRNNWGAPLAQKHPGCFEQPGCCPEIAHADLVCRRSGLCSIGMRLPLLGEDRETVAPKRAKSIGRNCSGSIVRPKCETANLQIS